MSSIISRATVSNCHGPRYAVRPGVLVNTHLVLKVAFGSRYGPGKIIPTAADTKTGHGIGYAPMSWTRSIVAAWYVPSASNAIRTRPCSRRDELAIRFSRRSSMYLSAAGTLLAASSMQMSSRCGLIFWPNAPPVSRAITRMRFSGTAEQPGGEHPQVVRRL